MPEQAQYYIVKPGGEPLGPFTLTMLKVMSMERRLTPEHLYCTEGMTEWLPVGKLLETAKFPITSLVGARTAEMPKTHLTHSIIMLVVSVLICTLCLPFTITAVVQSARADSSQDIDKRRRLADSAFFWLKIAYIVLGLQVAILVGIAIFD